MKKCQGSQSNVSEMQSRAAVKLCHVICGEYKTNPPPPPSWALQHTTPRSALLCLTQPVPMTILRQLTLINKELTGFWPRAEVNSTSDVENSSKKLFYLISAAKKQKKKKRSILSETAESSLVSTCEMWTCDAPKRKHICSVFLVAGCTSCEVTHSEAAKRLKPPCSYLSIKSRGQRRL